MTAVTVETVTLDPPKRMGFRLLRGAVPDVIEAFTFDETSDGTRLTYTGVLGTATARHRHSSAPPQVGAAGGSEEPSARRLTLPSDAWDFPG